MNSYMSRTVACVTKKHAGLDNMDNTTDENKPISTAPQTRLNVKAQLDYPTCPSLWVHAHCSARI